MTYLLLNIDYLGEITDGDRELELILLNRFQNTVSRCLSVISTDQKKSSAALHEMIGAAGSIGAEKLAAYAESMRNAPASGAAMFAELQKIADATLATFAQRIKQLQ